MGWLSGKSQQDTAEDVNPPDQGSELGGDYYWVEDAS